MSDSLDIVREEETHSQPTSPFLRAVYAIAEQSSWISSLALILLSCVVVVDATGRAFGSPLQSGTDIGVMLMVAVVFLALAGAQVSRDHVSMDALISIFPRWLRRLADRLNLLVCLAIGIFLAYGTTEEALASYSSGELALGAMMLPLWPAKMMVAIGFVLYSIVVLAQLIVGVDADDGQSVHRAEIS